MGRDENVTVFKDTERLCKTNPKLSESVKKATASQKLILEGDTLADQKKDIYEDPAKVVVSKKRTYEAAAGYKGQHVAVHNFASASNPGGGVVNGESAQEECLCRCSGLYFNLNTRAMWDGFYQPHRDAHDPIHNDDIIYTPGVTVFKTDTAMPELMPESDWYDVDVITCAAPNLRNQPSNKYNTGDGNKQTVLKDKDLLALHEKRLRRILEVALSEGCDTIILGAFGCGAFQNNPEVVAQANRNVIKDYLHAFKNIEFAVYCSPRDDRNFKIFERVLKVYSR
ncbi:MAG: TIGR02452 family protein [Lachnospiraceae bacterium]|nr:TIGR02452 family protein [Lachnospiraceae bacterium]